MLITDVSLKQRILCMIRISIVGAFSVGKKCALYTGKYGNRANLSQSDLSEMHCISYGASA